MRPKLKRNPLLNVGDRVFLLDAKDERESANHKTGTVYEIDEMGTTPNGKQIYKYYVDWDIIEGKSNDWNLPILSDVDIFFLESEYNEVFSGDESNLKESYIIKKYQLSKVMNNLKKNHH